MQTLRLCNTKSPSCLRDSSTNFEDPTKKKIALLTLLIEKWDAAHLSATDLDPVQLLQYFMNDHHLKAKDMVEILGISKGYVSDILHYKKGLSKEVIRKLAEYFKVSQEAFNRPYALVVPVHVNVKKLSVKRKVG